MRKLALSLSTAAVLLAGCSSVPTGHPHWGYSGSGGPENWAKLSGDYFACAGKNQSPINLTGFIDAKLEPLKLSYAAGGNEIVNNGHTIQVNFTPGSTLTLDNTSFELKQFHFHAPSENHVQGKSYPLEVHLVHAAKDGQLAVVALMYEEGAENAALKPFWAAMPASGGQKAALGTVVNASAMLPAKLDYYRFNGSLTTPPCSEGVRWLVLKTPVTASKAQISAFERVMHHANNRPLQPVNARPVLQ